MAFRIEKRAGALLVVLMLAAGAGLAQELQYKVWRGKSRVVNLPPRLRKAGRMGILTVSESGIAFEQIDAKKTAHRWNWRWAYQDIQQLKISPRRLTVLTYEDSAWKLGADRQYDFDLESKGSFEGAYGMLKRRLDQRLVAALPDAVRRPLWEVPVKHLRRFSGDEGVLEVGAGEIVYKSKKAGQSRTWRYEDIENISSSGPFQLTITTFEHARTHYGDRKDFNFALKQRLDENRYNDLWLRLNESQGLQILTSYRTGRGEQEK